MTLERGARVGHYEIDGQIGAGGMGSVYRAHDTRLKRDVAIKLLNASDASDARLLHEARAIHFIKRTKRKTPDLGALSDGCPVLCEVKTINVSTDEAVKRQHIHEGAIVASRTSIHVGDGFLRKLSSTLEHAIEQLDGPDPERKSRRMVFTVVHFDDWVGDYQQEYFAQIDEHLLRNPVKGAELVFCRRVTSLNVRSR